MAQRRNTSGPDLSKISIRQLKGLQPEDLQELSRLHVASVDHLMSAMAQHDGDLSRLSDSSAVIEVEQAGRIGDALLAFLKAKKLGGNFVDSFDPSDEDVFKALVAEYAEGVEEVVEEDHPAKSEDDFWKGLRSGLTLGFWK